MKSFNGKNGPLLIAEIGGNHEGNFDYAKGLTELACQSGVDAIKFQIYTGDTLVSPLEDPARNKHFKKFELSKNEYIELAELCNFHHVAFTSSIWDISIIPWIDKYMSFYKIGSGDLTAYSLLKHIAEIGKPIVLSTGLSTFDEVKASVRFIQKQNSVYRKKSYLAVLQCTSMYPIPLKDANLNVMKKYKGEFGLTVGYSDHTVGSNAVKQALSMGAEIIEMHFTDDREGKTFRDHQISFTKEEIIELIGYINQINAIRGSDKKRPLESEIESGHVRSFRRAIYPCKNIKKGEILTEQNITILRPNHGIDARHYFDILGKSLKKNISKYEKLNWDDIEH